MNPKQAELDCPVSSVSGSASRPAAYGKNTDRTAPEPQLKPKARVSAQYALEGEGGGTFASSFKDVGPHVPTLVA